MTVFPPLHPFPTAIPAKKAANYHQNGRHLTKPLYLSLLLFLSYILRAALLIEPDALFSASVLPHWLLHNLVPLLQGFRSYLLSEQLRKVKSIRSFHNTLFS